MITPRDALLAYRLGKMRLRTRIALLIAPWLHHERTEIHDATAARCEELLRRATAAEELLAIYQEGEEP